MRPACPDGFAATSEPGRSMAQRSPDRRGSEKSAGFPGVLRTMSVRSFGPRGSAGRLKPQEGQRQKPRKRRNCSGQSMPQTRDTVPREPLAKASAQTVHAADMSACPGAFRTEPRRTGGKAVRLARGALPRGGGRSRESRIPQGVCMQYAAGESGICGVFAPSVWQLRESLGRGAPLRVMPQIQTKRYEFDGEAGKFG